MKARAAEINALHSQAKYRRSSCSPSIRPDSVYDHHRAANLCFVSSLHDGMNLVAKEYVASRDDEEGVLILSQFAGASRELPEALIVNPYDADQCAAALHLALTMPAGEQRDRMRFMRGVVREFNVYPVAEDGALDSASCARGSLPGTDTHRSACLTGSAKGGRLPTCGRARPAAWRRLPYGRARWSRIDFTLPTRSDTVPGHGSSRSRQCCPKSASLACSWRHHRTSSISTRPPLSRLRPPSPGPHGLERRAANVHASHDASMRGIERLRRELPLFAGGTKLHLEDWA